MRGLELEIDKYIEFGTDKITTMISKNKDERKHKLFLTSMHRVAHKTNLLAVGATINVC